MNKVADLLGVGRTDDTHQVVISHPNPVLDMNGTVRIVVSPRHAHYLANLLTERASYAEGEAVGIPNRTRSYRQRNHNKRLSRPSGF